MISDANAAAKDSTARRSFLARLGATITGGILVIFPFAAGWGVFSTPLRRRPNESDDNEESGSAEFVPVCPLESLPSDGMPHPFVVTADIVDAWTRALDQRVGEVFLSRADKAGKPQVTAFTATCPHLGCAVEFDAAEGRFECPCHESGFAKDGKKLFGPSLRGLDRLEAEVRDDAGTQQVWVRFQRFRRDRGKEVGLMRRFFDWLDHRTGLRTVVHGALYEHIPGGARWRYVWGSTLSFCFFVQVVTGFVLWAAYSPSAQTAWESVYYIQNQMPGGWLLRGVHHFTAQAMIVLLAIHFLQVVVDGAYRAPREINFWIGLILMQLVLALALTGYLLPWDQKGYWATKVATNMMALVPVVGESLQRLVVGGDEYGHHTLTRFFALHAGVLPALLMIFLGLHVALFRRHGLTIRDPNRAPATYFWPEQLLRDAVACLAVVIVVLVLVLRHYPSVESGEPIARHVGAELASANPAESYAAARPEVYFLFLFQLLKYLEEFSPIVGAVIVPGLVMLSLFLMPIIGRWELGHRFNVVWTIALLIGASILTGLAWRADHNGKTRESRHYLEAVAAAREDAARVVVLADSPTGIPPAGALALLQSDPKTQGPKLFRQHCAACHNHAPPEGNSDPTQIIRSENPTAPNLWGFGGRDWIRGILDPKKIAGPHYFGNTAHKEGDMVTFVKDTIGPQLTDLKGEELEAYRKKIEDVTFALANEGELIREMAVDIPGRVAAGRDAMVNSESGFGCVECHKFHDDGDLGLAPDLTGYASREWLTAFISNPEHERFYPESNDRMPAFEKRLSPEELTLIVSWLRGDWYEPSAINPPGN